MLNNIIQKFKEQRNSIIYYALGLLAYTWLLLGMFPSMQKTNLEELTKNMPEDMMKFFGGDNFMSYSKIEGFLSLEYLSFFFILIICFYLGSSAGSAIAGAIEKRIIDFDLSQPISRIKYALSSFIVGLLNGAFLVIFNTFIIWFLCKLYDISINNKGLLAFMVTAICFVWAIYGIAAFLTSVFRSKLSVVLTTVVITLGSYVLFSLSNIVDKMKDLDKFSIFYLYNPEKLLENGNMNLNHLSVLLSIAILGVLSSLLIFNRKDI